MINFFSEDVKNPLSTNITYSRWIENTIASNQHKTGNINVIFCSDSYLLNLNKKYLSHDYFTDVITFDYSEDNIISGDIFISTDRVSDNAKQINELFEKELARVIIHGILHLLGYNDKSDDEQKVMRQNENKYLKELESVN